MAAKKALVILAAGAEEMETVISTDVLRRAKVNVTLAGLDGTDPVLCSRQVTLIPEKSLADAVRDGPYDVVLLPGGGEGARRLAGSALVKEILLRQESQGGFIAAVCAAPIALMSHDVARNKRLTSHPSVKQQLVDCGRYTYVEERVCVDGSLITSRGPGTCFEFALAVVEVLFDKELAKNIAEPMLVK